MNFCNPIQYAGYSSILGWFSENVVCIIVVVHQYVVVASVSLNWKFLSRVIIVFFQFGQIGGRVLHFFSPALVAMCVIFAAADTTSHFFYC